MGEREGGYLGASGDKLCLLLVCREVVRVFDLIFNTVENPFDLCCYT